MDRVRKAADLFIAGYNCSQSVAGAFCDAFGADFDTIMKTAEPLGGGLGRMRLTCGAVSGMSCLAGLKYSKAKAGDVETKTLIYETVRKMADEFKEKNGSLICSELLGSALPKDGGARAETRTDEFYKKRPCLRLVEDCARIAEKYLLEE